MHRNQVINIISNFKAENPNRYGIKKIGLLASAVRKSAGLTGDVDIVVDL
jgi:predicted nucleotidyltransferase